MVWVDQYGQLDRFLDDRQVESRLEPFRSDFVAATHAFVRRLFSPTTAASLVDYVSTDMASAPQRIAIPCLEATWAHGRRIPELLAEMKLAVVAINSRDTDAASMKRHGVDVIAMSGVGHFPMLEDPEQFDRCLSRGIAHVSKGMLR
jgi:pimeloyl-ACP methyl ester carboxylesterase